MPKKILQRSDTRGPQHLEIKVVQLTDQFADLSFSVKKKLHGTKSLVLTDPKYLYK